MGKFQPAKVNPEIKQYYVFDNFSGGINTATADDKMSDAEFRDLLNVDLSEYGSIKNRKGWAPANINRMFDESETLSGFVITNAGDIVGTSAGEVTVTVSAPASGTTASMEVITGLKLGNTTFAYSGVPFTSTLPTPRLRVVHGTTGATFSNPPVVQLDSSIGRVFSTTTQQYTFYPSNSFIVTEYGTGIGNNIKLQYENSTNNFVDFPGSFYAIRRELKGLTNINVGSGYVSAPTITVNLPTGLSYTTAPSIFYTGKIGDLVGMVPLDEQLVLFKVVKDNKNIFDKLSGYTSTDTDYFQKFYQEVTSFNLEILIGSVKNNYNGTVSFNLRLLRLKKEEWNEKANAEYENPTSSGSIYPLISSVLLKKEVQQSSVSTTFVNLTSLNYDKKNTISSHINQDKVYFLLNELDQQLIGIGVYDIENISFNVIYNDSSSLDHLYKPIPYEVTNIGYNVLAYEPIEFIDTSYTSIKEIREIQLTKYGTDDVVLTKIPANGKFRITFLLTGSFTNLEKEQLGTKLQFKYPKIGITQTIDKLYNVIPFAKTSVNGYASNLVAFDIQFTGGGLPVGVEEVYIHAIIGTPEYGANVHYSFEDMDNKYKLYNYGTVGQVFLVDSGDAYIPTTTNDKVAHKIYNAYQKTSTGMTMPNNFDGATGSDFVKILEIPHEYSSSLTPHDSYEYFYYPLTDKFSFFKKSTDEDTPATNKTWVTIPYTIGLTTPVGVWPTKMSLGAEIPINDTYHLIDMIDNPTFFKFSISDGQLTYIPYTNLYQKTRIVRVANTAEDEEPVRSLLFPNGYNNRMKMTFIQNNMVLYSGNSLVWSEPNIPLYIPNNNYIRLDIDLDDEIMAISYFRGAHLIFTKKRIYRLSGTLGDLQSMAVVLINDAIGCIASNSVRSFQNTVMFMSADGLYRVKQAYYTEGLENVEKVDMQIKGLLPYVPNAYAYLNAEQYHLFLGGNFEFDALRYYYEMPAPSGHPFVTDKYSGGFSDARIVILGNSLYAIKDNLLYVYNNGYYDFLPAGFEQTDKSDYEYKVRITTSNNSFGYATHDKKIKKFYLKIESQSKILIGGTVFIDKVSEVTGSNFKAIITDDGRISYEVDITPNMESHDDEYALDEVVVQTNDTITPLDVKSVEVVQLPVNGKGRNVMTMLETVGTKPYTIQSMGYTFKLGKVRANRRS